MFAEQTTRTDHEVFSSKKPPTSQNYLILPENYIVDCNTMGISINVLLIISFLGTCGRINRSTERGQKLVDIPVELT